MTRTQGSEALTKAGTCRQLGEQLKCSHETVRQIQSGKRRPTVRMRRRIAEALGIDDRLWDLPHVEPERPAPDLSAPPDAEGNPCLMPELSVAKGSSLDLLRQQRDRLLAAIEDPATADSTRLGSERLLAGTLKALAESEKLWDAQVDKWLDGTLLAIRGVITEAPGLSRDQKRELTNAIIEAAGGSQEAAA